MEKQDIERYIERLQKAFGMAMRKIGAELSDPEAGLTGPQYFILSILSQKGKCTVTELADEMSVKPSAITAMIDRLYKSGFVLRDRDEHDRRVVLIQLSDVGYKALDKAREKRKQILIKYLSHLEPKELESLATIYEKLARIVTTVESDEQSSEKIQTKRGDLHE